MTTFGISTPPAYNSPVPAINAPVHAFWGMGDLPGVYFDPDPTPPPAPAPPTPAPTPPPAPAPPAPAPKPVDPPPPPAPPSNLESLLTQLNAKLDEESTARKALEKKIADQEIAAKRAGFTSVVEAAAKERGAHDPGIVAQLLSGIEVDADGKPKGEALKTALDGLVKDKSFLFGGSGLAGDAGAAGAPLKTEEIESQIAEAEKKGDWKTAITLKRKLAGISK